ncbi:hypothetical protein NE237_029503 [Protea cynaroides]|uniref:Uncharacterized protein n=1 Tax=Protea cynaroides TaxID=273540 RepID=A0A9Q0GRA2_9MAGN|nr:hypothetical protein NE237_029503 [Protea cynaroides]
MLLFNLFFSGTFLPLYGTSQRRVWNGLTEEPEEGLERARAAIRRAALSRKVSYAVDDEDALTGDIYRNPNAFYQFFQHLFDVGVEPCTGCSLGRGGQPHRKIHYFFRYNWEGVLAVTETTVVLVWRGRFFGALIRRNQIVCNRLYFYGTTCGQSHTHESEWVRANHRKGGDGDMFFQSGWIDLLKGLPLNKGDILTFQYEGDVILAITTPHSMTGYEKVGSCGFLAV